MTVAGTELLSWVIAIILLGMFAVVLWMILTKTIDLTYLVAEPENLKASLSRFQMLIFTFVVAGLFMVLSLEAGQFVEIPTGVQVLLGISGGSYVISKAVTANKGAGAPAPQAGEPPKDPKESVAGGKPS